MSTNNQVVYSVYYLHDQGKTPTKIAKELNIATKEVKDILVSRSKDLNTKIKTKTAPINSKNLMITETSVKGTKNVAIMTKAASELNDEYKKTLNKTTSRTSRNAIFRPKNKS
jgi:hypothetical protein